MTVMVFQGDKGELFWERVKAHRGLLRSALTVREKCGPERDQASLELITFLANAGFGEDEILGHGFPSRYDYFAGLHSLNPNSFRLFVSQVELAVEIRGRSVSETLQLGHAHGYSTVVPVNEAGFKDYMTNTVSQFNFDQRYVLRHGCSDDELCFVHIEGLFFFPALAWVGDCVGSVEILGGTPSSAGLMSQLFYQIASLTRAMAWRFDGARQCDVVCPRGPGSLPILTTETNGDMGQEFVRDFGFKRPKEWVHDFCPGFLVKPFLDQSLEGHPKYLMDISDLNDPGFRPERHNLLRQILSMIMSDKADSLSWGVTAKRTTAGPRGRQESKTEMGRSE